MALVEIIPVMTSNTNPAPFVATASSVHSPMSGFTFEPWRSFNPDQAQWFAVNKTNQWLQIDLGEPRDVKGYKIAGTHALTMTLIRTWRLKGSNNGITWTVVHYGSLAGVGESYYENDFGLYRYWRVDYLSDNGANTWASITRFQLYADEKDTDGDGVVDSEDYLPLDPTRWQRPTLPTTKWVYDLAFLFSSGNPYDNLIGQDFELGYHNSEDGSNFAFRYKPYELMHGRNYSSTRMGSLQKNDTQMPETQFMKRHNISKDAHKEKQMEFGGWRNTLLGVTARSFYASLAYQSTVLHFLESLNSYVDEGRVREDLILTHRLQEEQVGNLIGHLIRWGYRMEDAVSLLNDFLKLGIEPAIDTVEHLYETFQRYIPVPEAELVGRFLLGKRTAYESGHTMNWRSLAYRSIEHNTIQRELTIAWQIQRPVNIIEYVNAIQPDPLGIMYQMQNFERDTEIDGVPYDVSYGTETDMYGRENEPYRNTEKIHNIDVRVGDYLFAENEISKEIRELSFRFIDAINDIEGYIVQETTRIESNGMEGNTEQQHVFIEKSNNKQVRPYDIGKNRLELNASIEGQTPMEWVYVDLNEKLGYNEADNMVKLNLIPYRGKQYDRFSYISPLPQDGYKEQDSVNVELIEMIATPLDDAMIKVDLTMVETTITQELHVIDLVQQIAQIDKEQLLVQRPEDVKHARLTEDRITMENLPISARNDEDTLMKVNKGGRGTDVDRIDIQTIKLPMSAEDISELDRRVVKLNRESWMMMTLRTMTKYDKVQLIMRHLPLFYKVIDGAYHYNEQASNEIADMAVKELIPSSIIDNVEKTIKDLKDSKIEDMMLAEDTPLEQYILSMTGANLDVTWEAAIQAMINSGEVEDRSGLIQEHSLAKEPDRIGLLDNMMLVNAQEQEKKMEGHVIDDYRLSGDGSDWEDIWNRYTPGVDILDPPDSDFDYSTLAEQVYDLTTGVPKNPTGPTNQADVKVPIPLHHPLPQHFDLGIDESRELPVDNYILIDVILAIESIKNRNKLRYAGMPAEKVVRELFSSLFTWIQQAAPNDEQYDRMFRFSRWYAEAVTVKLSSHILHRTYDVWRSSYHEGAGLGITSHNVNWPYLPSAFQAETTGVHASLKFTKENYIDGEIIIRGYFDNPLNEGTMKIMVDGIEVDSFTSNGVFTKTYEVLQGKHTYEFVFDGTSGKVMLSTIDITGCRFVSAFTTSDDSDTNGLKATTMLVSNLLTYYDLHHGDGKTKGTMQIKQRRVWNTQT